MTGYKEINKGSIYYETCGEGFPIVFIHGFSVDHRMWDEQVKVFSKSFEVITYDMRGFGKSSLPTDTYSYHDDLFQLLRMLRVKECILVGLSLGGEVALDFTIKYPDYVNGLVLLESSLNGYSSTVNWDVHAKEQGIKAARLNWLNHEVFVQTNKNPLLKDRLENIVKDYSGWHWLNKDCREKLVPPAREQINEISKRTLIIVGEKDLQYYHDISKILASKIRNSHRVVIQNAGHMVNLECPKEVNRLLEDFFISMGYGVPSRHVVE